MSDIEDIGTEEDTTDTTETTRRPGRKTNELRFREAQQEREKENRVRNAERRKSGSLNGFTRDRLALSNQNPNFVYYWVLDSDERGSRVSYMSEDGWEMVDSKRDQVKVGGDSVYDSPVSGSIYRAHNRDGRFLYLMRIRREWYEQDQKDKDKVLREQEEQIFGVNATPLFGPTATYMNKTRYE